jgi:hypothetical protein
LEGYKAREVTAIDLFERGSRMRTNYIALAVNSGGEDIVLRPIVASGSNVTAFRIPLAGLKKQGLNEGAALVGAMLLTALSAYHRDLDQFSLLAQRTSPMPYKLSIDNHANMSIQRMGLGVAEEAAGPVMLVVRRYEGDRPIGDDSLHSLKQLALLGENVAPSVIGEVMLRKLAALHPDVLAPLFPTIPS